MSRERCGSPYVKNTHLVNLPACAVKYLSCSVYSIINNVVTVVKRGYHVSSICVLAR